MLAKLQTIFNRVFDRTDFVLTEGTVIKDIPDLTSLSMLALINELEITFDITVPNSQIKRFKTVKNVISFLEERGVS